MQHDLIMNNAEKARNCCKTTENLAEITVQALAAKDKIPTPPKIYKRWNNTTVTEKKKLGGLTVKGRLAQVLLPLRQEQTLRIQLKQ